MGAEEQGRPTLVVMAAGMGSRYGGLKQVEAIGPRGETLLDYSVFDAHRAGFSRVVFVLRRDIEAAFRDRLGRALESRIETAYAFQELDDLPPGLAPPRGRTRPWGTAHALLCARREVDGPFAVINADDFYGAEAYRLLFERLSRARAGRLFLVGYRLEETLSEHGHVSRGICEIADGDRLTAVVERTRVQRFPDGIRYATEDDRWLSLSADSVVSMNLWGLAPDLFEPVGEVFREFVERNLDSDSAECHLPTVVNALVERHAADVRVLHTGGRWFGLTHREDRSSARERIAELIRRGDYPERLWD
jgi:NDP-sugar pyrophosphorylase family protein